jgi:putative ABC transport system permease protein
MESFAADVRHAVRVLVKSPGFSLVAISALALGIGANTAIFSVVNAVLLSPLPYPQAERIVKLGRSYKDSEVGYSVSLPKFFAWKQAQALEATAAYDQIGPGFNLGGGDRPEQVKSIHVSREFFKVFGVAPMLGRTFDAQEDLPHGPSVAILSHNLWKTHFGADPRIVGRAIILNGDPHTVIGVMPDGFQSDPVAQIWVPLQADPNSANQGHYLAVAARLRADATLKGANAQLKIIGDQFRRANPKVMGSDESVAAVPMREAMVGDVKPALLILTGAVGLVLLIACANVANLLLARAAGRQRELAIRTAIGASRGRIVRQLLTESVLLAGAGGALGFALGAWGVRALLVLVPGNLPRITDSNGANSAIQLFDWRIAAFTIGVSLATGILFGLFPALRISRPDLNSTLKEASSRAGTGLRHNRTRSLLVVTEMALALVLLVGAALLIRSFAALRDVQPGFDSHHLLTLQTSMGGGAYSTTAKVTNFTREVLRRIESLPGVEAAATTLMLPIECCVDLPFSIEGRQNKAGDQYAGDEQWRSISPHYFAAFKIPLFRGRIFNEGDTAKSSAVVIINDAMAKKYWPKEDPVGRIIVIGKGLGPEFDDAPRQIVGVVASVHEMGLNHPLSPVMYIPGSQAPEGITKLASQVLPLCWVVRTSLDPMALNIAVQREMQSVDASMSASRVRSMDQVMSEAVSRDNFNMLLLSIFAGIALTLAAIGIYGLIAYSVEQRTQEIGIRMALGAGREHMLKMVIFQGMRLAIIGVVVGLAIAYGLTRVLASLLFGIHANDPLTFAGVTGILTLVALLATWIPARRAMRIDPIVALRYE